MKPGYLVLETGEVFTGQIFGHSTGVSGEIVFNTSMTGYQDIIADPSSAGQIVVFSYPLIGSQGINQNIKPHVAGIVTGELFSDCEKEKIFAHYQIPCLTNVDTRTLIKTIRKTGTIYGVISEQPTITKPWKTDSHFVNQVASKTIKTYVNKGPHVVLLDFGYKQSVLSYLLKNHCKVSVVPYDFPLKQIADLQPDAIILSNGPGDPAELEDQLIKIKKLSEQYSTLGIGLGHQLVALAYGAKTKKLPNGHRGANHPVKDLQTGKVFITSQNHGYVVFEETVNINEFEITFKHVNDRSIEGMKHKDLPLYSVQFHPEVAIGTSDTEFIFNQFIHLIGKKTGVKKYAIS